MYAGERALQRQVAATHPREYLQKNVSIYQGLSFSVQKNKSDQII
jgi:hypothetical protein